MAEGVVLVHSEALDPGGSSPLPAGIYQATKVEGVETSAGVAVLGRDEDGNAKWFQVRADGSLGVTLAADAVGVATEATLALVQTVLSSVDAKVATEVTLALARALLASIDTKVATETTLATRAAEHVTAASPHANRLSDGTAFYKATTPADTQPVSATALPLPSGAATEATLSTRLTESTYTTRQPTPGQSTMAGSVPVVVASDQSALPVAAASLPLPVGAATAVKQDEGNASLSSLDAKTATAVTVDYDSGAGSQAVQVLGLALPGDGGAVAGGTATDPVRTDPTGTTTQPVSAAALPLPAGAATAAKQDTEITSLASIDGKLPATVAAEHVTAGSPHANRLSDGTAFYKATTPSDTQPVSAVSLPLPSGAATESTVQAIRDQFSDTFTRMLEKRFRDSEEVRYDIPAVLADASIYLGTATDGTSTAAVSWSVVRYYFDVSGSPQRARFRSGVAWDDRATGWS